jgi:hypothetical protein
MKVKDISGDLLVAARETPALRRSEQSLDFLVESQKYCMKSSLFLSLAPLGCRRIGQSPMQFLRPPRPEWTRLGSGIIADGDDKMHLGRTGL